MNKGNGKTILIFLLAIVWIGGIAWLYFSNTHTSNREVVIIDYPASPTPAMSPEIAQQIDEPIHPRCGDFLCFSNMEFVELYDLFERKSGVEFFTKYIYQIPEVDVYIKAKAETRGYKQRGFADESQLVQFENVRTRPEVRDAYLAMRNEMLNEGIRLHFVSGYRSSTAQRDIFTDKMKLSDPSVILDGSYDEVLDTVLAVSAIPGYSKHHSGYTVDFGCGNDYLVYTFAETECFEWMSQNNFERTKKHGFIPSYPEGVSNQGPDPEPWEFVWVGIENLK